ncbi:MAG: TonB-dependent receptor [Steroidobacter sp.]|nr:TonB-dependent receptor [Steroidobacter sp.]
MLSEVLSGSLVTAALNAAGFSTFSGLQYFTNAADTRTRGVDVTGRYGFVFGGGHELDLSLGYNHNETEITSRKPTPAVLAGSNLVLIGRESAGIIEQANPRSFSRLGLDYSFDSFSAHLAGLRYGTYKTFHTSNPALDQTYGEQYVVNLSADYRFTQAFNATLGVNNLFDSHPDKVRTALRNPVVSLYSNLSPEGGAGSIYYARFNYSF